MRVAELCYLMGKRYGALGDHVTAQKWFTRSLRIREPHGPSEAIGKVYLRIAEYQLGQKNYASAAVAANRAETNMRQVRSEKGLISSGIVLAGVYSLGHQLSGGTRTASLDSALYFLRRSEKFALGLKDSADLGFVYSLMGSLLESTDLRQGVYYLKKAYTIGRHDKYALVNLHCRLAHYYLRLKQPQEAQKWLDKASALRDASGVGNYGQSQAIEEAYTQIYQQSGQWEQAFVHQENYYKLVVRLLEADRDGAIARIEKQYETTKQAVQLNLQRKELAWRQQNLVTQQKLTLMTSLLCLVACIACAVLFWLVTKYRRLSMHNARLVQEQNHRVKNNLQSITSLLNLHASRLTDSTARQAVEESLLRVEAMALIHQRLYDGDRLVEVNMAQYIPELVDMVLRGFSFGYVQPAYQLDSIWLDADDAINVGLLLNELVTNACKYAFPGNQQPTLAVGFQDDNGQISFWFADNGPGFRHTSNTRSFGMTLINMIVQKLKGRYHFDTSRGCRFSLTFNARMTATAW